MKHLLMTMVVLTGICGTALAIEDTPENRAKEADRYVAALPANELLDELSDQMLKKIPPEKRQLMKELLKKNIDMPALEKAMKKTAMKHFTADELAALANFCSTPAGKSAMKKFVPYLNDLAPALKAAAMKGNAKKNHKDAEEKKDAD